MGDAIKDMNLEIEQKDNEIDFLENNLALSDSKVTEEMNKLRLNKT